MSLRVDPGQYLKRHHHRNANESLAAAALTKSMGEKKLIHNFFLVGDTTICMYQLPSMSLFVTNFGFPLTPLSQ